MRPWTRGVRSSGRSERLVGVFLAAVLALSAAVSAAARPPVVVQKVRIWTAPDHTRIVLDLSSAAAYEARRVADPDRFVINIPGARFAALETLTVGDGVVARIRRNVQRDRAQLVVDLATVSSTRHFRLPAAEGRPPRIVVDLFRPVPTPAESAPVVASLPAGPVAPAPPLPSPAAGTGGEAGAGGTGSGAAADSVASPAAGTGSPGLEAKAVAPVAAAPVTTLPAPRGGEPAAAAVALPAAGGTAPASGSPGEPAERPFTVIIDPGHGGMDPGAVRGGQQEKDITLAVARELAKQVEAIPGWRAVLTRQGDYFVTLGERVRIARRAEGDVFVSLHCNTHPRTSTDGMEVYFLSLQGATDHESQELADQENAADLVGLDPDEARNDSVVSILMDMKVSYVLDRSSHLSELVLGEARRSHLVGGRRVKQAGFKVLRSLAMPAALVELAYLSNDHDRMVLVSETGRRRLAGMVAGGLARWRGVQPAIAPTVAAGPATTRTPAGKAEWTGRYRVRRGDSLSRLADLHGTTVAEICRRNGLATRNIMIGQRLRLPAAR